MAFCKCGGLVALATAHTIQELTASGKDALKWQKQGFRVELRETPDGETMPRWCDNPKPGTCSEYEIYLAKAKERNWPMPVSDLFKPEVWLRFWKDMEWCDSDHSVDRPVVPHRSA
jgi:hypothetical protein